VPNIRLIVEYDGSCFHGWQKQPNVRTVQEELEKVLKIALREDIPWLAASGRTDSGVHAKGQVVNFHCQNIPDLHRLKHSVSSMMKGELAVRAAEIVDDSFHSCKSTKSKQYTYTILHRHAPAVLDKGRVWHVADRLDIGRMQREARVLVGTHDFTSLQGTGCQAVSPIKEIFRSEVLHQEDYLIYEVVGAGFLKHMVRNIVGTLIAFGRGDMRLPSMEAVLAAQNRRIAGMTAPAHGLCLDWVEY
jgi:tRNA pseudouridine38-40 synthase